MHSTFRTMQLSLSVEASLFNCEIYTEVILSVFETACRKYLGFRVLCGSRVVMGDCIAASVRMQQNSKDGERERESVCVCVPICMHVSVCAASVVSKLDI